MATPDPATDPATAPPEFVRLAAHPLRWRLMAELAGSDHRVRELAARVEEPQNLVSYHLRLLRDGGLVSARRSSFDGRDTYYHLDLDRCADALARSGAALHPALHPSLHPALGPSTGPPARTARREPSEPVAVLFVCTGNSARSPIAEALLRHRAAGRVTTASAGSRPRPRLHPGTVRVLRETYGIDVHDRQPRHLDSLAGREFDHVITMCDKVREVCPEFGPRSRRAHWSIPDPGTAGGHGDDRAGHPALRRTAADIDTRIRHLLPVLVPSDLKEG